MIIPMNFNGGMAEAVPPELLKENQAALIQNMRIAADGSFEAVRVPREIATGSQLPAQTWDWNPVYLPTGCSEDVVYVCFGSSGNLYLVWKTISGETEVYTQSTNLLTGIDVANLRVSYDSQQFLFVDGREGMGAQRIVIDSAGAITCRRFGTQQPITAPVIHQIDHSKFEDQRFTGMPVGSILFYAYCIINEYGERSNPSPVAVCDTAQWMVKGELLDSEYIYSEINTGSIKSVSVECTIPVPSEAKRIELYRTSAEYHESSMPVEPAKLVLAQDLTSETASITLLDSNFYSPIAIDYENDVAPAGDDIALESGTVFIANAVADRTFAVPVAKAWRIVLNNRNDLNYVNRWIALDLRDDVAHALSGLSALDYLPGFSIANLTGAKYRFVDTDMITPLTAYVRKGNGSAFSTMSPLTTPTTVKYWGLTYIQIPYVQANSEKVIYLIEATSEIATGTYGSPVTALEAANYIAFHDAILDNPVRDEKCILALGRKHTEVQVTNGWERDDGNKANAMYVTDWDNDLAEHGSPSLGIVIDEELGTAPLTSAANMITAEDTLVQGATVIEYEDIDGMIASNDGYMYCYFCSPANVTSNSILAPMMRINFWDVTDRRSLLVRFLRTSQGITAKAGIYVGENIVFGSSEATAHIATSTETGIIRGMVFVSWQRTQVEGSDETSTNITLAMLLHGTARHFVIAKEDGLPSLQRRQAPSVFFYPASVLSLGYWYVGMGEYVQDQHEIVALSKFLTHFPLDPIGYRSNFEYYGGIAYITNQNVTITALVLQNDKRPGRIRWSNGGAVPEMFERNAFQEIMCIVPTKSFQPTDEHNTVLIWTRDKLMRMSLSGDNKAVSSLIPELKGVGLQNRNSLVQVDNGVIWSERTGIYFLTPNGQRRISEDRILPGDYTVLFNSQDREILFLDTTGNARIYKLDYDVWTVVDYGITARAFMTFEDKWCLISDTGAYELWPEDDDTTLTPLIRTRKIPAKRKWGRITLHSSGGTVKALIHNHRIPGGQISSPVYTLTGETPCGIPGLSGDHIQLEIETDNIKSFDIEVKDGQ